MSQSRKFLGRSAMSSYTSAYSEGETEFRLASRTNNVSRHYFTVALIEDSLYDVQSRQQIKNKCLITLTGYGINCTVHYSYECDVTSVHESETGVVEIKLKKKKKCR